jgi:pyridoxal phosphate enzyme (YggS family)
MNPNDLSVEPVLVSAIRERYSRVSEAIYAAAKTAGREPDAVRLVVVTKTHPPATVRAAIAAGARDLGENYVEEALEKIGAIGAVDGLRWHMIGHVQSRKAEQVAAGSFQMLHSLDSLKLAGRLDRFAGEAGHRLPVLLEVNVSGEESKFGYPAWNETQWQAWRPELERLIALPNLEIRGLMSMPPFAEEAEASRPFFEKVVALQAYLDKHYPQVVWKELSMGTSVDYAVAVATGATLVRVGTAILGSRPGKVERSENN